MGEWQVPAEAPAGSAPPVATRGTASAAPPALASFAPAPPRRPPVSIPAFRPGPTGTLRFRDPRDRRMELRGSVVRRQLAPRRPLAPRAPHFVPPALHRPPAVRAQGAHDAEVRLRRRDLERRVLLHDARADRVPEAHRD